ncbi:class I SAM-dependent methyltransferase [Limisalsivibrio acetivorans]|uniref:class I SAM-dependent methyltransferase n=1 Tax=Limisalsivibrio acetivorans TaxID=1304888 RepID=UPI0003B4BCC6|nr:class I SAM-dependent methyltransferase [Limisalsivibrio acetivorans]
MLSEIFYRELADCGGYSSAVDSVDCVIQQQTGESFGEKWTVYSKENEAAQKRYYEMQKRWYLELYGFDSEASLGEYLRSCSVVLDAGCGLGHKSAWFAEMAPDTTIIGMDISSSIEVASERYGGYENLHFVKGDIADTGIHSGAVDYVSCDQVLHHTTDPGITFDELASLLSPDGEFACYVYRKKAIPRELLDTYFREECMNLTKEELWEFSKQMTELGRVLSGLDAKINVPDIPALGIEGGEYDLQRFLYWNFFKCYWNEELGEESSVMINFDWYSPAKADRYSREEFMEMAERNFLKALYFHTEPACYSGRFGKI